MIGGMEMKISTRAGLRSLKGAVGAVRRHWPLAQFENSETGDRYGSIEEIPFESLHEIFVYRDAAAADSWDAEGASDANSNTMIHLLADPDVVTMVVDNRDGAMQSIANTIEAALTNEAVSQATFSTAV